MNLSNYEKIITSVSKNAKEKIIASIELYKTETANPSSFYLATIAQEELSKLVLLPIAREVNEIKKLLDGENRTFSPYYNHKIKQKIFVSYGLQNRKYELIESNKQKNLYCCVNKNLRPKANKCKKQTVFLEIKHAIKLFRTSVLYPFTADIFPFKDNRKTIGENFSKNLEQFCFSEFNFINDFLNQRIPELSNELFKEEAEEFKLKKENTLSLKKLFLNPYCTIEVYKVIFGKSYKDKLKEIQGHSFEEAQKYFINELTK